MMKPGDKIIVTQVETGGCLIERTREGHVIATHIAITPARTALLVKNELETTREDTYREETD